MRLIAVLEYSYLKKNISYVNNSKKKIMLASNVYFKRSFLCILLKGPKILECPQ